MFGVPKVPSLCSAIGMSCYLVCVVQESLAQYRFRLAVLSHPIPLVNFRVVLFSTTDQTRFATELSHFLPFSFILSFSVR